LFLKLGLDNLAGPGCSCLSLDPSLLLLPANRRRWRLESPVCWCRPWPPAQHQGFRHPPGDPVPAPGSRFRWAARWAWSVDRQHPWRRKRLPPWPFQAPRFRWAARWAWQVARWIKAPVPSLRNDFVAAGGGAGHCRCLQCPVAGFSSTIEELLQRSPPGGDAAGAVTTHLADTWATCWAWPDWDPTPSGWNPGGSTWSWSARVARSSRCCRSDLVVLFRFGGLVAFAAEALICRFVWCCNGLRRQWQCHWAAGPWPAPACLIGLVDALLRPDFIKPRGIRQVVVGRATVDISPCPGRSLVWCVLQHPVLAARRRYPRRTVSPPMLTLGVPLPAARPV